jgi:hypothetical protein
MTAAKHPVRNPLDAFLKRRSFLGWPGIRFYVELLQQLVQVLLAASSLQPVWE